MIWRSENGGTLVAFIASEPEGKVDSPENPSMKWREQWVCGYGEVGCLNTWLVFANQRVFYAEDNIHAEP